MGLHSPRAGEADTFPSLLLVLPAAQKEPGFAVLNRECHQTDARLNVISIIGMQIMIVKV